MRVKYLGESSPIELLNGKVYEVLSVEDGWYRIVDETFDDYLYPPEAFEIVAGNDGSVPVLSIEDIRKSKASERKCQRARKSFGNLQVRSTAPAPWPLRAGARPGFATLVRAAPSAGHRRSRCAERGALGPGWIAVGFDGACTQMSPFGAR